MPGFECQTPPVPAAPPVPPDVTPGLAPVEGEPPSSITPPPPLPAAERPPFRPFTSVTTPPHAALSSAPANPNAQVFDERRWLISPGTSMERATGTGTSWRRFNRRRTE